jgi:hypothetical protein
LARRCGRFTADGATIPSFIVKEKLAAINAFQELTLTHLAAYIRPRIRSLTVRTRRWELEGMVVRDDDLGAVHVIEHVTGNEFALA